MLDNPKAKRDELPDLDVKVRTVWLVFEYCAETELLCIAGGREKDGVRQGCYSETGKRCGRIDDFVQ